jgi:hypothetical protein
MARWDKPTTSGDIGITGQGEGPGHVSAGEPLPSEPLYGSDPTYAGVHSTFAVMLRGLPRPGG